MELDEGRRMSRLVGGGVLILVGLLLALSRSGAIGHLRAGDFWPMILIWIGATRILSPSRAGHLVSGVVVLGLGVFFQLDRLGWLGFSVRELWPYLLVGAGAALILEGLRSRRAGPTAPAGVETTGSESRP